MNLSRARRAPVGESCWLRGFEEVHARAPLAVLPYPGTGRERVDRHSPRTRHPNQRPGNVVRLPERHHRIDALQYRLHGAPRIRRATDVAEQRIGDLESAAQCVQGGLDIVIAEQDPRPPCAGLQDLDGQIAGTMQILQGTRQCSRQFEEADRIRGQDHIADQCFGQMLGEQHLDAIDRQARRRRRVQLGDRSREVRIDTRTLIGAELDDSSLDHAVRVSAGGGGYASRTEGKSE